MGSAPGYSSAGLRTSGHSASCAYARLLLRPRLSPRIHTYQLAQSGAACQSDPQPLRTVVQFRPATGQASVTTCRMALPLATRCRMPALGLQLRAARSQARPCAAHSRRSRVRGALDELRELEREGGTCAPAATRLSDRTCQQQHSVISRVPRVSTRLANAPHTSLREHLVL